MSSKNSQTRNRILKSSLKLLEASQGKGIRMSDIAKHAGISRQALYLHFATRAELLIATTHYLDEIKGAEERLAPSRSAKSGIERLEAFIDAWGGYLPEIHAIANALIAMADTDEAAASAWNERMRDMREGCEAAINALAKDGNLSNAHSPKQATDLLWMMLSVRNWEHLTMDCGWSREEYIERMKVLAQQAFVVG